ncbi:MAG: hypothetical protein RLY86_898 [Pseudomonadota bacterium]|jgi:oligopeptide transport system substrate-binding protein
MRLFRTLALVAGLVLPVTAIPPVAQATIVPANDVIHIGNGPAVETLDPHKAGSVYANTVLRELFEGLLSRDAAGNLIPGAAESWTVSPDGTVYTFTLRADGRWSDGTPVTAADFVWSWQRAVNPATLPYFTNLLYAVRNAPEILRGELPPDQLGVRAVDDRTVEVTLSHPDPNLLTFTTHYATYPVHRPSVEQHGAEFTRPGNLIGNGAYVLTDSVPQSHIQLRKNPHFHDAAKVAIEEVWFHVTDDQNQEVKRFRAGQLHVTERVPVTQMKFVRENLSDRLRIAPMAVAQFVSLNLTREPWKSNADLRKALYLAIDRDGLVRAMDGEQVPAYSLIPPGLAGYVPPDLPYSRMTQAERDAMARELLAKAGYGPRGKPLTVNLLHTSVETNRRLAVIIAAMWKQKLGIETVTDNQEFRVIVSRIRQKDFPDLVTRGWRSIAPTYAMEILRRRDPSNNTGYDSDAFEELMTRAETAVDITESNRLLQQAEAIAMAETAQIPLYFDTSRRLIQPNVQGWVDNLEDIHPVRFLSLAPAGN